MQDNERKSFYLVIGLIFLIIAFTTVAIYYFAYFSPMQEYHNNQFSTEEIKITDKQILYAFYCIPVYSVNSKEEYYRVLNWETFNKISIGKNQLDIVKNTIVKKK